MKILFLLALDILDENLQDFHFFGYIEKNLMPSMSEGLYPHAVIEFFSFKALICLKTLGSLLRSLYESMRIFLECFFKTI